MRPLFTLDDVATWTGGRVLRGDVTLALRGLSIDTRTLELDQLFAAVRGPKHDAHAFLTRAVERGASALLVDAQRAHELPSKGNVAVVEVDDTTAALGRLARGYRATFSGPLVCITGSSGKTTTKEMCASILSAGAPCLATRGNLNNEYGVPLTLMRIARGHASAVVELGMNHRGEIARLAEIAAPTVALVTNAGVAHIEFLGSRDAIAQEKGDLFAALGEDGVAVANADDPRVLAQSARAPGRVMRFAREAEAEVRAESVRYLERGAFGFELVAADGRAEVEVAGLADTSVINALAASAAAIAAGACLDQIAKGLADYAPSAGRMNPLALDGGRVIVDDSYNANPLSLEAAFEMLSARHGRGRAIAVVGDMGELGDAADEAHRAAGQRAGELGLDKLFAIGQRAQRVVEGARGAGIGDPDARVCSDHEEAAEAIRSDWRDGDWVLVKGSRAMKMERVVRLLSDSEEG